MSADTFITQSRTNVLALLDGDPRTMEFFMTGYRHTDPNKNLQFITARIGLLALSLDNIPSIRGDMREVFGFVSGWLTALGVKDVQNRISAERDRQDKLFVEGEICFNCASRVASPERKLRVIVEEVGEVADAIEKIERINCMTNQRHLITELVQVAAVAVAWLESLEGPITKEGK